MVEVKIDSIRVSLMSQQHVVILKDMDSNRYLPIWIGRSEAESINMHLQKMAIPRPLTHDLAKKIIEELGAKIVRVVISDLFQDTFYARIDLAAGNRTIQIDSRSSDAIALAIRAECPIFVEDNVMAKAAVMPDSEEDTVDEGAEASDEDLGAFSDFINTLDTDEPDREK
jgi:hypothetical protein